MCDRVVGAGLLLLLLLTPLAFGSVHPWAYIVMEAAVGVLAVLWVVRMIAAKPGQVRLPRIGFAAVPLAAFAALIGLQLLPLPPATIRLASPSTYELYAKTLPGWPERSVAQTRTTVSNTARAVILPTEREVREGAPIPSFEANAISAESSTSAATAKTRRWRPLSIAPSLTSAGLYKFAARALLFVVVFAYPFGARGGFDPEGHFERSTLAAIIAIGALIATIGLLEDFTWNGRIFWFFVPYDWDGPLTGGIMHARGPFINYDHFANYLAMIFPLALAGLVFPGTFARRESEKSFQLFSGFAAFVIALGIMLSLSRAGWIALVLGPAVFVGVMLSLPVEKRPGLFQVSKWRILASSAAGLGVLLLAATLFLGADHRAEIDARFTETITHETSLWTRLSFWKDSLAMVRDFPLFGVGLKCWPEIFRRYQRPPYAVGLLPREAHNDYVQLLTEAGLLGFAIMAWFFGRCIARFYRWRTRLDRREIPAYAAIAAAIAVMGFHELFDFSMQIPANAILFWVMLAIAMRLVLRGRQQWVETVSPGLATAAIVALLALIVMVARQGKVPYPYDIDEPGTVAEAERMIDEHPASVPLHLWMFGLHQGAQRGAARPELAAAMWLSPTDPIARDLNGESLMHEDKRTQALAEITRSVANSPDLASHLYLTSHLIPYFRADEQHAVESGLKQAVAANYGGAVNALGEFYGMAGRPLDRARVYRDAALREGVKPDRVEDLIQAGQAYVGGKDFVGAEHCLRAAIAAAPSDARPYEILVREVFAQTRDLTAAKRLVSEGIGAEADSMRLYLALGAAAQTAGDNNEAESALKTAVEFSPESYDANLQSGIFYAQQLHKFELAAIYFEKATSIRPDYAQGFGFLGDAEESAYQFSEAEDAFAAATRLDPDSAYFRERYENIKRRSAKSARD